MWNNVLLLWKGLNWWPRKKIKKPPICYQSHMLTLNGGCYFSIFDICLKLCHTWMSNIQRTPSILYLYLLFFQTQQRWCCKRTLGCLFDSCLLKNKTNDPCLPTTSSPAAASVNWKRLICDSFGAHQACTTADIYKCLYFSWFFFPILVICVYIVSINILIPTNS